MVISDLGAEAEIAREGEIERQRQQPGQRLPPAEAVALGERAGGRIVAVDGARVDAHGARPNRPCGRHSSSRIVMRVDEHGAALRQVFLQREVEHADDQRRIEHAGDAAEPADRDDDQEHHQIFQRILRIEAEELGAEPAAERRHAAAEGEGDGEQPRDVDAERFRHAPVVDRGADLRAHAGALEAEPQAEHDDDADHDQHDAVGAVGHEAEVDLALHRRRQVERLGFRPDDQRHRRRSS